jgi:glycerol transport system ATP-binding protein
MDEPLANLDYKLREELRDELPKLFAGRNAIVVYATTEPSEALLFGGNTATLHEGRVTQFGPTSATYRAPRDLTTAQVFSDPPINTAEVEKHGNKLKVFGDRSWPAGRAAESLPDGRYIFGIRPHYVTPLPVKSKTGDIEGRVLVTELSGSESVIHLSVGGKTWVSQSHGIHPFEVGSQARLHVEVDRGLFFLPTGELVS